MSVRPKPARAKGAPPSPRRRARAPYQGYVKPLTDCMAEPGEWFSIHTSDTRTYGYQVVKNLRAGNWALPDGTVPRDWAFQVESSYDGGGTSEVFAMYRPRKVTA